MYTIYFYKGQRISKIGEPNFLQPMGTVNLNPGLITVHTFIHNYT